MLLFYKLFSKRLSPSLAMYFFLLVNITFWFLAGTLAGVILGFCFLDKALILSFAVTSGGCLALAIGYVYGYIAVIRNS